MKGETMNDPTENIRREMTAKLNAEAASRLPLEEQYGQVWDTSELQKDFSVLAFAAPFVVVERKSDGVKGTLMFQHSPRFYFAFEEK